MSADSIASTLVEVVEESLARAEKALTGVRLDEKLAKAMVKDMPPFRRLTLGGCDSTWAAILFVDLRRSTHRAQQIGARRTFLTMHALLPALAHATSESGGCIVGFRGDGLFAAFGLDDHAAGRTIDESAAVSDACRCGQWMIEATEHVVTPALQRRGCPGGLHIGVGVDCGTVIVTRIGLHFAEEVTAYGDAVNYASKLAGLAEDAVLVSEAADTRFPTNPGGKVVMHRVPADPRARRVEYHRPLLFPLLMPRR